MGLCFLIAAISLASPTDGDPLHELLAGNERFATQIADHPHQDVARRIEVAKGQKPIAAIVCCSDSRVAPELVFDQGLGDLFVVRCAGNTIDAVAMGSLEYAVEHLGVHQIVVMGHEKCGAVKAAIEGGHLPGSLPAVVAPIHEAVVRAKASKGDVLHNGVRENVLSAVRHMSHMDGLITTEIKTGKVQVTGMVYDLESGRVTLVK